MNQFCVRLKGRKIRCILCAGAGATYTRVNTVLEQKRSLRSQPRGLKQPSFHSLAEFLDGADIYDAVVQVVHERRHVLVQKPAKTRALVSVEAARPKMLQDVLGKGELKKCEGCFAFSSCVYDDK